VINCCDLYDFSKVRVNLLRSVKSPYYFFKNNSSAQKHCAVSLNLRGSGSAINQTRREFLHSSVVSQPLADPDMLLVMTWFH